ncbi:MAG: hypothetical protein V1798_10765 [Pseudomonadota bacterium]
MTAAFEGAAAVFKGVVTDRVLETNNGGIAYKVTFRVDKVWKGPQEEKISVFTNRRYSACGYPFVAGREYLVYTRQAGDGPSPTRHMDLVTGLCTRTTASPSPEEILALDEAAKLVPVPGKLVRVPN